MLALAGLWMASLSQAERAACHQQLAVVTTSWVMQEPGSNLEPVSYTHLTLPTILLV